MVSPLSSPEAGGSGTGSVSSVGGVEIDTNYFVSYGHIPDTTEEQFFGYPPLGFKTFLLVVPVKVLNEGAWVESPNAPEMHLI